MDNEIIKEDASFKVQKQESMTVYCLKVKRQNISTVTEIDAKTALKLEFE